jgi:hypothetical protein
MDMPQNIQRKITKKTGKSLEVPGETALYTRTPVIVPVSYL